MPNLFELPVLFYAGCIVAFVTGTVDTLLVGTAWLFVLTRYVHSYFHLTAQLQHRFMRRVDVKLATI
ncbi:MAG: MAPEG family protein [Candidatus Binatia bacterium]